MSPFIRRPKSEGGPPDSATAAGESPGGLGAAARAFGLPVTDYLDGLGGYRGGPRSADLVLVGLALVAAWFVYVPVHELLHAAGCRLSGGVVSRLDIAPQYGAALLREWLPFVHVGSDYAGRLSGFDTGGSDLVYLATVSAPYLLTVFLGVPLLRSLASGGGRRHSRSLKLGAAIPVAYAPFISLAGDYYEMGSIPASRLAVALTGAGDPGRWRSDDLPRLVERLFSEPGGPGLIDGVTVGTGFLLGVLLAFATYWLGVWVGRWYGLRNRGPDQL